ncbi:hypothetical protein [Pelomonas sp. BJYL3]|uniref:hypothetical protein n=1 Tax=Pelomonas sp. BJYL3 TaxID=2976697 RepID=UPI0022B52422|nr:hypothetical protein [Pelomonas sp. BJYL3]
MAKFQQCWAAQDAAQKKTDEAYDRAIARCASNYPDPTGTIGIGGSYAGTGGNINIPADWVSSNPEKRRVCQDKAKEDQAADTRYNEAVGNSCRTKAVNGG